MAQVNSLICWGGHTGKANCYADAGTDRVTLTKHGIKSEGLKLWAISGIPSGLSAAVPYWGKRYSDNEFELYTDAALTTRATWTTTSSTLLLKSDLVISPAARLAAYGLSDLSRWYSGSTYKIYDGLYSWYAARVAASDTFTEELCEIGEAFYDMTNNQIDMNFRAPKVTITSKINGIWGPGFHAGVYDAGFTHLFGGYGLIMRSAGITVEGFSLRQQAGVGTRNLETVGFNSLAQQMFFVGVARTTNSEGMRLGAVGATAKNCVAIGLHRGFSLSPYSAYLTAIGCFATDNTIGFGNQSDLATNSSATAINCLSIGNATDWFVQGPLVSASNNAGLGTEAWMVGSGATRITIGADWNTTTPLFRNYANKDYRPYIPLNANSTLLVEAGTDYYNPLGFDIAGNVAPAYMNGGAAKLDVGAYEHDPGYGPWPSSTTVTFIGVNAGSEIRVYNTALDELAGVESSSSNPALTWQVPVGDVRIVIIHPDYKIKEFTYTTTAGAQSLPVQQERDKWYSNPA